MKMLKPYAASPSVNRQRSNAGAIRDRMYTGSKWRRLRAQHLARFPLCQRCLEQGLVEQAEVVDHVHGHGPDWEQRFYDPSALQSLCAACHSEKTAQEVRGGRRRDQGTNAKQAPPTLHAIPRSAWRRSTP